MPTPWRTPPSPRFLNTFSAFTYGLNGIPEPAGKPWAVDDFDPNLPQVDGLLAAAHRARAAGAQIVIASVHCCTEYVTDPTAAQVAIASALLASPDVDLVLGHHGHVMQPFERIGGKWVAYGLGNHIAQQDRPATYDSVIARFIFTPTRRRRPCRGAHPARRPILSAGRRGSRPPRRHHRRAGHHHRISRRRPPWPVLK